MVHGHKGFWNMLFKLFIALPLAVPVLVSSCATGAFIPSPASLFQDYVEEEIMRADSEGELYSPGLNQKAAESALLASLIELPQPSTYMYETVLEPDPWHGRSAEQTGMPSLQEIDKAAGEGSGTEVRYFLNSRSAEGEAREIARRRFEQAFAELDAMDRGELERLVGTHSAFDAIQNDSGKAKNLSLLVSASTSWSSKYAFSLAFAAAVFAMDSQSRNGLNNLAAAILDFGEWKAETKGSSLEEYWVDAKSLYTTALELSLEKGRGEYSIDSLPQLVNLGNLLVDAGALEEARGCFLAARGLDSRSWEVALGLASTYIAQGNAQRAALILRDPRLERPAIYAAAARSEQSLGRTESVAGIPLESPEQVYEQGIAALQSEPLMTAAEFVAGLDQEERNKMRYFVENLPVKGSFVAPPITIVAQYSSLKAISQPMGIGSLMDFSEALGRYAIRTSVSIAEDQIAMAERMGMDIDIGIDLDDVAAHPEKYQDYSADVRVSGQENAQQYAAGLEKDAAAAEAELATGKSETALKMASTIDPAFTILRMNPADYADPFNLLVQRHNFTLLNRKTNAYKGYMFSTNKKAHFAVEGILRQAAQKLGELEKAMEKATELFDNEKEAAEKRGENTESAEWKLKEHRIHQKYFTEMNSVAERAWSQATSVASVNYLQKIKPQAEAYYYDVLRHIALISDPGVRAEKDRQFRASLDQAVHWGLCTVLVAYGSLRYHDEWDCDCDIKALLSQREEERKQLDKEESERIERSMEAKKRFESGEIPDSSPLFKKLDSYGTDLNIPFIPFLSGRVSCARTVVNLDFKLPVPGSPSFSGGWAESAFTGARNYRGKVSVGLSGDSAAGKVSAALTAKLSIDVDGQGVISDYPVAGGAKVSLSGKAGELGVGGEVSVGADGNIDSDFSASAQTSLKSNFGEATVGFEASTSRGNRLTGKLEQSLGQMQELLDEGSKQTLGEEWEDHSPTKDLLKKELWTGAFAL